MFRIPKALSLIIFFLVFILLLSLFFDFFNNQIYSQPENFLGITLLYSEPEKIIELVDLVEDYVNLIIIGELNVTKNSSKLYPIFDYLHSKGLYFIPFMAFEEYVDDPNFFNVAKDRWQEHFLGVYIFDEPGGKQIDELEHRPVTSALNYSDAKTKYVQALSEGLNQFKEYFNLTDLPTIFTSDYALYWFDYSAGYDTVLSQLGWNQSSQLNIALCRGAATAYNRDWGSIITWTFRHPPYILGPDQLYEELVLAYNNGVKYNVVFNFPTNLTQYGVLTEDHLQSIKNFSDFVKKNEQPKIVYKVAYVLPENYGYGFRGSEDKIWGLWESDELSSTIFNDVTNLLEKYNSSLEIIYEPVNPDLATKYKQLIFWNGTTY